jgi:hypothetical protein
VLQLAFGPRTDRPANPFLGEPINATTGRAVRPAPRRHAPAAAVARTGRSPVTGSRVSPSSLARPAPIPPKRTGAAPEPVVALAAYEALRDELDHAEEVLEDALVERGEN